MSLNQKGPILTNTQLEALSEQYEAATFRRRAIEMMTLVRDMRDLCKAKGVPIPTNLEQRCTKLVSSIK